MFARVFLCALLVAATGVANAKDNPATAQQKSPAQQLTPEQRAAIQKQNEILVKYADRIIGMIDHGEAGQVWDQASEVAKKAVTRDQFIQVIESDRAKLGTVKSRKLAAVTRTLSNGKGRLPAGYYVNVNYVTQFSKYAQPIRELVSFHLDGDKKRRLSGYTVHAPEAAPHKK